MRVSPGLLLAATMLLCTAALAQDQTGAPTPAAHNSTATTGAAPSGPAAQAPIGHRQPRADSIPRGEADAPSVSPYDQQIDRDLNICKGC